MIQSSIYSWNVTGKTVILRIDGNVPIAQQQILDDHKLIASLATINYLLDHGAQLMLLAHIQPASPYSTITSCRYLVNWFAQEDIQVELAQSIHEAQQLLACGHRVVMLENLAKFPQEMIPDRSFAQAIAQLGTFYINDAFAALTHEQTSITIVPQFFDIEHKSIGFLIEHELRMLNTLANTYKKPFLLFIGGQQGTKLNFVKKIIPHIDGLYLGPALNFSFLKASGDSVGLSSIAPELFNDCHEISMLAEEHNVPIHYPQDYITLEQGDQNYYTICSSPVLDTHEYGISIGPKTAAAWARDCTQAHTILLHGLMGFLDRPQGLVYFKELLQTMHDSSATTIITGSNTVAAAHLLGLAYDMRYCSTGGNSTLALLSNTPLVGLNALTTSIYVPGEDINPDFTNT